MATFSPGQHRESSSEEWDDTETYGEEEGYWADGEEYYEADDEDHEQDDGSRQPWSSKHVWLSDREKVRVAFKRARDGAAKIDLDRSPYFPRTAADYVGLKADRVEAKAAQLKAKVAEKEKAMGAQKNARWKTVAVVGASGQPEEKRVLVYHEDLEGSVGAGSSGKVSNTLPQPPLDTAKVERAVDRHETTQMREGTSKGEVCRCLVWYPPLTSAQKLSQHPVCQQRLLPSRTSSHVSLVLPLIAVMRRECLLTWLLVSRIHPFGPWPRASFPLGSRPM